MSDRCANCGGERGLHHYQTDQCPVGGREVPVGRDQEWKTSTFNAIQIPFDPPVRLAKDLTIREYFAAMAMQGLLANHVALGAVASKLDEKMIPRVAVAHADMLIKALN